MEEGSITYLLLIFVCLVLSAMFSATETAFASVSRVRIAALAEDGDKKARRLNKVLVNFDRVLTALLILNNIVNIAIATLATLFAAHVFGEGAVEWMTVVTTVVVFLFGESLPKATALMVSESLAYAMAGPMIFLTKVFTPLIFVLNALSRFLIKPIKEENTPTVTEEELESIIDTIVEEDAVDEDTGELLQSAIDLSRTTAEQIMTPWEKCLTLSTEMSEQQILDTIKSTTFSRFPVIDKNSRPIGFVSARAYIKVHLESGRPNKLRRVLTHGRSVRADEAVDDLLGRLSAARTHMAFVRDAQDKVLGIITVEDILEELVGEIYDEDDKVAEGGVV